VQTTVSLTGATPPLLGLRDDAGAHHIALHKKTNNRFVYRKGGRIKAAL
jgi:hypothetical protein